MNLSSAALASIVATTVMTTLLSGSQAVRLTRISIPFMLGTMLTPDRDLARALGFLVHLVDGWIFALIYAALFQSWGFASWWLGASMGLFHALFVLLAAMPVLPGLHPRMASEERGPTPTRLLEPPGILALNYGRTTPITIVVAHIVYGALMGALYHPS